jgi:sugar/nucleoside kinase (ribokinase family)
VREEILARPVDADPTGSGDMFTTAYVIARNGGFGPSGAARRATAVVASILAGK